MRPLLLTLTLSLSACHVENTKRPSEFESCLASALEPYRRLQAYVAPQSTLALIEACRRATRADGLDDATIDIPSGASANRDVPPALRYAPDASVTDADSGMPIEGCRR